MKESAKTRLKWEKWQRFLDYKGFRVCLGKYELHISENAVDGIKMFQGWIISRHTNQGSQLLPDEHTFGPKTSLPEIKQLLLEELKEITADEIQSLAQVFTDDELKKIGLTRT